MRAEELRRRVRPRVPESYRATALAILHNSQGTRTALSSSGDLPGEKPGDPPQLARLSRPTLSSGISRLFASTLGPE